jgi:tyrosine-protein kinase Etk/Wzc
MMQLPGLAAPMEAPRPMPAPPAERDALGLRSLANTVMEHRRLVLAVFLTVLTAAFLKVWFDQPVYKIDALVQIDTTGRAAILPALSADDRDRGDDLRTMPVSGEMEILRSREIVMPAMLAEGGDVEIRPAPIYGFLPRRVRDVRVPRFEVPDSYLGENFQLSIDGGRFTLADEQGEQVALGDLGKPVKFAIGKETGLIHVETARADVDAELIVEKRRPLSAYDDLRDRTKLFQPSRDSGVVRISMEDTDPTRGAAILNGVVRNYLEQNVRQRTDDNARALDFVETQLPEIKARVERAESELSRYQQTASAIPLNTEAEALLRQSSDLERERVLLQIKRDQLGQRLTPEHPEMAAILTQLATIERAVGRVGANVNRLPVQQRDRLRLQRDLEIDTQLYTTMLARAQELRVARAGYKPAARLIDPAVVPIKPVRPKSTLVMSVAAGLGLVLALAAAMLARVIRPTVSDAHDMEMQVGLPTFAVIPYSDQQQKLMQRRLRPAADGEQGSHRLLARAAPNDPAVESLRALHMSLALRARTRQANSVILISSPTAKAGKSFVACNLAALIARSGKRVLLLETDLRNPGVHRYTGLDPNAPGLSDLLLGRVTMGETVQRKVFRNLDVMLHGTRCGNPAELLLSSALEQTMVALRSTYDHVVIDSAPLLPVGDTLAVGRLADVAMVVVRAEESSVAEAREAVRRLNAAGLSVEGLLFNGVRRSRFGTPSYGYGPPPLSGPRAAAGGDQVEHTLVDLSYRNREQ